MNDSVTEQQNEFGLINVIEAFTALRQEFRNRSNEDRELAKQLGSSTEAFGEFAQKIASMLDSLEARIAEQTTDQTSQRLAACLAEVDHSVSHAIARSVATETIDARNAIEDSLKVLGSSIRSEVESLAAEQGFLARRFAGSFVSQISAVVDQEVAEATTRIRQSLLQFASQDATLKGLSMLGDRVNRLIESIGIVKIETLGKAFDGEIMNAIASTAAESLDGSEGQFVSGTVVEQISPAYLYAGKVLRYAEVNVSL